MTTRAWPILAGLAAMTHAVAADAQSTPAAADTVAEDDAIDDIVVTARRREESARSVPVSIVALGARELEERQVRSLADLTNVAPGIRFVPQGGSGNVNIVLRGLAKGAAADSPNSVISYFGDVPLYFRGSDVPAFDLRNVQVLKGPQGTLFGRNSIGGAIILAPETPGGTLTGYTRASIGNYDLRDVEGAINLPIAGDRAALRVAAKVSRRDGYVRILNQGVANDDIHRDAIRASLLLQPTEAIRNITVADYLRGEETDANALLFAALPTGLARLPALAAFFDCGAAPNCDIDLALARQQALGFGATYAWRRPFLDRTLWGVQNRTEIDLGPVELRNIFGYRETTVLTHNEAQGNDFGSPRAAGPGLPILGSDISVRVKQVSDEVQALGKLMDDRLDWIVGFFTIREDPFGDNAVRANVATVTAPFVHAYNYRRSDAVFGQIGFKLTDAVKFNAGYRHTWEKSRVCSGASPSDPANPAAILSVDETQCATLTNSATVRYTDDAPTYTLGLDWQASRALFLYAAHRRGFRAGGVNSPAFVSSRTAVLRPYQSYGPETLSDIELGVKSDIRVAEVPVRANLSVYRSTYSNVQTSFNVANLLGPPPLPADAPQNNAMIINSGKRRFLGAEGELVVRPTPNLTFGGNAAWIRQEVLRNDVPTNLPGLVAPVIVNLSPKWATSASARWRLPIAPAGGAMYLSGDYYYQSSFFVGNARFSGYDVANARLEWERIGGSGVGAAAFVRNAFNNRYYDAAGATAATLGFFTGHVAEPRLYGLELSTRF